MEGQEGLYIFFKTVCDDYNLIPEDNYTISPEAEGVAAEKEVPQDEHEDRAILKNNDEAEEEVKGDDADAITTTSTGATTRRHKHTPSVGSAVTTIMEGDEDDTKAQEHKVESSLNHSEEQPVISAPKADQAKEEEEVVGSEGLDEKMKDLDVQDQSENPEKEKESPLSAAAAEAEKPSEAAEAVIEAEEAKGEE